MATGLRSGTAQTQPTRRASLASPTRRLLQCGVAAGPIFLGVVLLQMLARPGFDLTRHALSQLSLGDVGGIQIANFIVAGVLVVAGAIGLRRAFDHGPAAVGGPLLVGVFGLALIGAGAFTTDPSLGFPPGTPNELPSTFSWHAILHSLAFMIAGLSVTAAAFVLARRFASETRGRWAASSVATGLAVPILVMSGLAGVAPAGLAFFMVTVLCFGWLAAIASHELTH